ncbi:tyrosine-type recombinase/integrase [Paraburkholderia mimosarum]|uniref:tyrosine-type recombinase/integrase n=1 Tax=Paraburkholderia mimosarum TaxID=312026 RepID=UPI000414EA5C|nr:site-specific integrase [Paraburkholderia mimosarum]
MATKLTTRFLDTLAGVEKVIYDASTTGLCITPTAKGKGKWSFRYTSPETTKRREAGLGAYPDTPLAQARAAAATMAQQVQARVDPLEQRKRDAEAASVACAVLTFEKAARAVHAELSPGWRNEKHAAQWIATLETYAFPVLGAVALADVTPKLCADALRPIWLEKPETASRVRQRMGVVMSWAWAHGLVAANPVAVVDHLLPAQSVSKAHQPAMPWRAVPAFVAGQLSDIAPGDTVRAAVLFALLTAARSGEVRAARWGEFDLDEGVWTVPALRMKAKVIHRVPLAPPAVSLLRALRPADATDALLVFPSVRGKVLSDMTLTALLRRVDAPSDTAGRVATLHGFRSSFRDWASEHGYPRDLAERALSHVVANKVEAAYHRTDLLEQRRPMMDAWAAHVLGLPDGRDTAPGAHDEVERRAHAPGHPADGHKDRSGDRHSGFDKRPRD